MVTRESKVVELEGPGSPTGWAGVPSDCSSGHVRPRRILHALSTFQSGGKYNVIVSFWLVLGNVGEVSKDACIIRVRPRQRSGCTVNHACLSQRRGSPPTVDLSEQASHSQRISLRAKDEAECQLRRMLR